MNHETLINKIEQLIYKGDFSGAKVSFFNFIYDEIKEEKPPVYEWNKIRALFLSDANSQQLAFQLLEGQGFQKLRKTLEILFSIKEFQNILHQITVIQSWQMSLSAKKRALEKAGNEYRTIEDKLTEGFQNEKDWNILQEKKKKALLKMFELVKSKQEISELFNISRYVTFLKNILQKFFNQKYL